MILQVGLQIILPAFLLLSLWRERFGSRLEWVLNVLAIGAILLFVFLTARWDFTSYYLRFVWPLLFVVAVPMSLARIDREEKRPGALGLVVSAVLSFVFLGLSLAALRGYTAPDKTLQLAYPLKGGTYYVGGGGNARLINNHQAHEPQRFALDIVRLNAFGNRATGLAPGHLTRYTIFGDTVYSPCTGAVVQAVDGSLDHHPPERDESSPAGNHVVLACGGAEVVLAHLKQGSVVVTPGTGVEEGDVLGQVGNSGTTSQPHLHLHAERGGTPNEILNGEGVPIELDGRFLVRNSLFRGQ
jgi:hypothetical protein